MAKKHHKRKSSKKHKRSKHRSKKRDRRSGKKHRRRSKTDRTPRRSRGKSRGRDKKHKPRHGDKHRRSHDKKKHGRDESHHRRKDRHPDMTAAAMNENLGNIVLVKNRHKAKQTDAGEQRKPDAPGEKMEQPTTTGPTTMDTTTGTTIPTTTTPGTGAPQQRQAQQPYVPPDVVMVPLAGSELPTATSTPLPPTKTTTTTTGPTTGGVTPTSTATSGQTTTDVPTSGAPVCPPSPDAGQQVQADELTRKEKGDEKSGCDKQAKWKNYMEKSLDAGLEGMAGEFRAIRGYLPPMATRMACDANVEKNRFEDIVCIDQTRVRLGGDSYIHASWVNITANRKAILTQLPLVETGGDFWQMVLDTNAQAILLLLTHAEFNMFHAAGVFPAEQDFVHFADGHIRVGEFKRVVIDRDWTMHVISVKSGDSRRYVHMHHYSGWVHGKQPANIQNIWQIQSVFRKYSHPHIYMSLSGCGRAGTYAAFEIAHERLHSDAFQRLNISDCICRARNGRMHAVQRAIQLQTIHAIIMEHIMSTKFSNTLATKYVHKYEEFMDKFSKCGDMQEEL
ncbi:hypothetical protein Q1695_008222 [Nippostrongylus brasiliensis]|nr:hypothetical protein Q1695_008222 [Nippostrongylus brasiliensis]